MSVNKFLSEKGYNSKTKIESFGLVNSFSPNTLSYLMSGEYIEIVNKNSNISCVFCSEEHSHKIIKETIVVDDPLIFFELFKQYSLENKTRKKSIIHSENLISKSSFVAENNVVVGRNTKIYPNVTILSDVEIGEGCEIYPGAVIGSDGAEFKKINGRLETIFHNGKVIIGDNVTIGANVCIDKGIFGNTEIKNNVKIDNLVHIAHNVVIEDNCYILANTTICGSTRIKKGSRLSPSATITNGIEIGENNLIGLGAVQFKSSKSDQIFLGNPSKRLK